jgi:aryl-alcohol dehydrogenase-like predicted oxidoreductase
MSFFIAPRRPAKTGCATGLEEGCVSLTAVQKVPLGKSGVLISPMGVGTNAWGKAGRARPELQKVFEGALSSGITLFDTAEIYGRGGSERTVGLFLKGLEPGRERPVVLSKFFPLPWRLRKAQLLDALRRSLERLQLESIDIYLIHFPWSPLAIETWVNALADAAEAGLVRAIGVSNYDSGQVRRAHRVLTSRGIVLACNEFELSLARRAAEKNGTLAACRELDVAVIAYRPLALGHLTGRASEQTHGWRRIMAASVQTAAKLPEIVQEIGKAHGGKTPAQVALNWVICKGALPIPGATGLSHLEENIGALGWRLTDREISELDGA